MRSGPSSLGSVSTTSRIAFGGSSIATGTTSCMADRDFHFRLQIGGLVADDIGRHGDLVVALHVHEVEAFAVLVHELVLAVLDKGPLDLIGGLDSAARPSRRRRSGARPSG